MIIPQGIAERITALEFVDAQSTSPRVRNNGNNVSGNHLEFDSPYYGDVGNAFETIGMALPSALNTAGQYLQVAAMLPSSSADDLGAWMFLEIRGMQLPFPSHSMAARKVNGWLENINQFIQ